MLHFVLRATLPFAWERFCPGAFLRGSEFVREQVCLGAFLSGSEFVLGAFLYRNGCARSENVGAFLRERVCWERCVATRYFPLSKTNFIRALMPFNESTELLGRKWKNALSIQVQGCAKSRVHTTSMLLLDKEIKESWEKTCVACCVVY